MNPNSQNAAVPEPLTAIQVDEIRKGVLSREGWTPFYVDMINTCFAMALRQSTRPAPQRSGPDSPVNIPEGHRAAIRDAALEEAATMCEQQGKRLGDADNYWGPEYANRIRALKNAAPQARESLTDSQGQPVQPARAASEAGPERVCPECGIDLTGGTVTDCCIGICPSQSATSCAEGGK